MAFDKSGWAESYSGGICARRKKLAARLNMPKYRYDFTFFLFIPMMKFIPPIAKVNPLQKIKNEFN